MSKLKPQVPPKPYPAPPDVITMSKGMVHFIIDSFITQVIAKMREELPNDIYAPSNYDALLKDEAYRKVAGIMQEVKYNYREMKYIRGKDIKVEFTDET